MSTENVSIPKPIYPTTYKIYNSDNDTTIEIIDKAIRQFLNREGIHGGASVAVGYKGRIVYAKGIGWANIEDSITMQPYNVMRIASVSKLITAIAVLRLVEDGKIDLHQKVFGPQGILNDDEYLAFKDKRMAEVTIYQLLNHSGGWTANYGDPMFMPHAIAAQMGKKLPIKMKDIIRFMQSKSMHFNPGSVSIYSNFGYGILGEVVAKVSGMPYENYVRSEILYPLGIYDMQIGHSHKSHLLPTETLYYESDTNSVVFDYTNGEMVRRAYGGTDIQTLGSAGGWVASSIDLLKIVMTVDGFDDVPDQLSKATIDTMTHRQDGFDPIGWRTTIGDSWYRSGSLATTSAIVARHPDSLCYVVILNGSNHRGPHVATSLRICMDNAVAQINTWPDVDLLANDEHWKR